MDLKDHGLWCEKYRPQTINDYIGNEHLKEKFQQYVKEKEIPHLLLGGSPGVGKTTMAKMLVSHIDCDYIYINASDENSVDVVRDKIKSFASSIGFKDIKICILDECLHEDTLIAILNNGKEKLIKIKEVDDKNQLIKSYNVEKNRIEWVPFQQFFIGEQELYEIEFESGEVVKCTSTHKWYVEDNISKEIKIVTTNKLYLYNHILSPK